MADIRHLIDIKVAPERLVELVGTPEGLAQWWAEDLFDVSDGACSLGFFDRDTVYRLRRQIITADKAVWISEDGMEWAGTRLLFTVQTGPNASQLRFTHAGWRAETDFFTMCNTTWGELMFRLMAVAEGKVHGPLFKKSEYTY